jgi:phospholipid-binding lipoprotein MlaA
MANKYPGFKTPFRTQVRTLLGIACLGVVTGCSSLPAGEPDPDDPHEGFNRSMYEFNDDLDRAILKPVADGYTSALPQPVRTGVSNFYDNLTYLDTTINSFLQGKVMQGTSDLGRFIVNTTLGIAGIFDVATYMGLEKHDEDFGQTLAVWGVKDDQYLMYPVLGPSSVRDTGGVIVSMLTNPVFYAAAPVAVPLGILQGVDQRARKEGFVRFRDEAALDPYLFTRDSYLQNREFEILDGNLPRRSIYDEPIEPAPGPGNPKP